MEDFEWNVVNEGHLLDAMVGHKPIGINKHFQMAFICEKFADASKKDVPSSKIWSQLDTMYNLEALNETETLPFPNEPKEFSLPDTEFSVLKRKKEKEQEQDEKKSQKGRETPKNLKEIKKEEVKTPANSRNNKNDTPRRDSKEKDVAKETKTPAVKKEVKKEPEPKGKAAKGRNSLASTKEENKRNNKREESPRPAKRPTRGSLKPDETNGGKASPLTVTPAPKRRRI